MGTLLFVQPTLDGYCIVRGPLPLLVGLTTGACTCSTVLVTPLFLPVFDPYIEYHMQENEKTANMQAPTSPYK